MPNITTNHAITYTNSRRPKFSEKQKLPIIDPLAGGYAMLENKAHAFHI